MKNTNLLSKIFLYLCALSGLLWTGAYFSRLIYTYQLFEKTDYILKPFLNNQNLPGIFTVLNAGVILTCVLYIIFIISFILFLVTSRLSLKENGWLFVITLVIVITAPFEIYLMTIDHKLIDLVYSASFNVNDAVALTVQRLKMFGSFPLIELVCYFAISYLFIFQPLKMNKKKTENED
jgi:hypothetical protein